MRDVRPLKKKLREEALLRRDSIELQRRHEMSLSIADQLTRLISFKSSNTVLTYVSVGSEVSTFPIMERCFAAGKRVAVPKCAAKRRMDFYIIDSPDNLSPGRFGIPEPDPGRCELLTDFRDTLCLVPALSFDRDGNRLGYGGGYYDSFISGYPGVCVGLCYHECLSVRLPACRHDEIYHSILTEKGIILCR